MTMPPFAARLPEVPRRFGRTIRAAVSPRANSLLSKVAPIEVGSALQEDLVHALRCRSQVIALMRLGNSKSVGLNSNSNQLALTELWRTMPKHLQEDFKDSLPYSPAKQARPNMFRLDGLREIQPPMARVVSSEPTGFGKYLVELTTPDKTLSSFESSVSHAVGDQIPHTFHELASPLVELLHELDDLIVAIDLALNRLAKPGIAIRVAQASGSRITPEQVTSYMNRQTR